jgi:hypothetical protein
MSALTVTLGADITALKRAMAGATEVVGASARRMGSLSRAVDWPALAGAVPPPCRRAFVSLAHRPES